MEPSTVSQYEKQLLEEKALLEHELGEFAVENPKLPGDWNAKFPEPLSGGPSASHASEDERADLREEYESELAQEHTLELRLREVARALKRIAEGTYGACASCGKPISDERLRANPAAEFDIEHQPKE